MRRITRGLGIGLSALLVTIAGCSTEEGIDAAQCGSAKCDTPDDPPEESCDMRRNDALNSGQRAFTPDAIRWATSDVDGVNTVGGDDRGQEYTEYFAIVQPPPRIEGGELPDPVDLGRNLTGGGTTDLELRLTEDQIFALEDDPTAVVGQCIFTSWHSDVPGPLPICSGDAECPSIYGFELNEENFRMKVSFNSNVAASALVRDCLTRDNFAGDPSDPKDPLHDDYTRGCMLTSDLYGTHWRRSDPTICAAALRLKECGCGVDVDGDGVADDVDVPTALVPTQPQMDENGNSVITLRGFPLGTWSGQSELPAGCRYFDVGDDSQTLVTCDLTADDLLKSQSDPKGRCRAKYADNVVVHVPIPSAAVVCAPPTDGQYAGTCSDQPWVVTAE